VRIVWPDGTEEIHNNIKADRLLIYEYGDQGLTSIVN
jgi:hypothetical protein